MKQEMHKDNPALKRTIESYNLVIIALLCSTTLSPAVIFYVQGPGQWMWLVIFVVICYGLSRIPISFLDKIQFSRQTMFYRKWYVHLFKKLATNGDFINRQIRRRFPYHRNITDLDSI